MKLILFLVVFCFVYPVFLKFFPLPTDRIIQLCGFGLFILTPNFWGRFLNNTKFTRFLILLSFFALCVFIVQAWNESSLDFYFLKINVSPFFYFFSSYLIVFLLAKIYKTNVLIKLFDYIIYVALFQAVISIVFFIKPSLFDIYSVLIHDEANQNMLDRIGLIEKRMIGIGSAFFMGVTKYGVAFFCLIVMHFTEGSYFYRKNIFFIICSFLLIFVGVLTGRTFFLAIVLGILLLMSLNFTYLLKLVKFVPVLVLLVLSLNYFSSFFLSSDRLDNVMFFVTEIFDNYSRTGKLSTSSSDATLEMYVFPDSFKTWLVGDGRMIMDDGSYYMTTDVGFSRLVYYFGLPLTIFYFIYQGYLLRMCAGLNNNQKSIKIKKFFLFLFLWLVLLNFKGLANTYDYIVLFFICSLFNYSFNVKKV